MCKGNVCSATTRTPCQEADAWVQYQTEAAARELELYYEHKKSKPCPNCQFKHLAKVEGFLLENAVMSTDEKKAAEYLTKARQIRQLRKHG